MSARKCPIDTPAKRLADRILRMAKEHSAYEEAWGRKTAGLKLVRKTWMRLVGDAQQIARASARRKG